MNFPSIITLVKISSRKKKKNTTSKIAEVNREMGAQKFQENLGWWNTVFKKIGQITTPPKLNSSPMKNAGWKTILSYWVPVTFQWLHVNFKECTVWSDDLTTFFLSGDPKKSYTWHFLGIRKNTSPTLNSAAKKDTDTPGGSWWISRCVFLYVCLRISNCTLQWFRVNEPVLYGRGVYIGPQNDARLLRGQDT